MELLPRMGDTGLWDGVAGDYEQHSYHGKYGCYPANRARARLVTDYLLSLPAGRLLDAGCGTGYVAREAVKLGWDVVCADLSEPMLAEAGRRMSDEGLEARFLKCSVTDMGALEDGAFDAVMMLGVLPYVSLEDEARAYGEARRVLVEGGSFIAAQYNMFFDLLCVTGAAPDVYRRILESAGLPENTIEESVSAYGAKPGAAASEKTMKSENPLSYDGKLRSHGFQQTSLHYYNFHVRPDVRDGGPHDLRWMLESSLHDSWQGLFLAKTFLSISRRL